MYQIVKNGTKVIINAQDLQTAVVYLRSLESNINRANHHSPYTIVQAPNPIHAHAATAAIMTC